MENEVKRQAAFLPSNPAYNQLQIDPQAQKVLELISLVMGGVGAMGGAVGPGIGAYRGMGNLNPGRLPARGSNYPNAYQDLAVESGTMYRQPHRVTRGGSIDDGPPPSNAGPARANLKGMDLGVPQLVPMRRQAEAIEHTGRGIPEVPSLYNFGEAKDTHRAAPGKATYQRKGKSDARPY